MLIKDFLKDDLKCMFWVQEILKTYSICLLNIIYTFILKI